MATEVSTLRRSRAQWEALVRELEESGLSALAFSRERGVGYLSLLSWKKRFAQERVESVVQGGAIFQEMQIREAAVCAPIEIVLGGFIVRVPAGAAAADVRGVLTAIMEARPC